ncbi:MAG: leucine-rich repeat domain-containing protein [Candidatus Coproplasma sp.]
MKKFISIALAATSIALACSFAGCNTEATVNYTLSEDGTYYIVSSVTGNKNALKECEIPATYAAEEGGEQLPVTAIADQAFYQCRSLRKITIPDTVKTIGNLAFALSGLVNIDIPDSVETIGYSAFGMCSYIEEVVIPSSVTSLGDRAFMGCTGLKRAEVYANISDLKVSTFYNSVVTSSGNIYINSSLTEIVLSASITKIANSAIGGNRISDIYFMGTEEQWNELYFYKLEKKESDKEDDEAEFEEIKVEKNECIPSTTKIHFNYVPEN